MLIEGFVNWYFTVNNLALYLSFITIFSIMSIYIVVIIHYFQTTMSTHHSVDHYEGYGLHNIKTGVLCQWRNETKLSTSYFSFMAKLPFSQFVMRWKRLKQKFLQQRCLWQRCLQWKYLEPIPRTHHHYYLKHVADIRVHSWHCIVYGFWSLCADLPWFTLQLSLD